jgi:biopolymer transport protein ExbD
MRKHIRTSPPMMAGPPARTRRLSGAAAVLAVLGSLSALRPAQADGPAGAPGPAASPAAATTTPATQGALFKLPHLTVDRARGQIVIEAEVCFNPGPLEVLLCKTNTKDYESILRTQALPSNVHAGLLALGLSPGKPARMSRTDTQPASLLPPQGPRLAVTLRWKDKDGNAREAPAGEWLTNPGKKKVGPPQEWVFVGSDMLPGGRYWADQDGDIISLSNFASAVIDVPFESTAVNASLEFAGNEKAIPPKETPVEVVLQVLPGAQTAPAARTLLEIDRFGQFWIEGRRYDVDELGAWAEKYLQKHPEGMVVIRADARAQIQDLERARDALRLAGVADLDEQRLSGAEEPAPHTAEQAGAALKRWQLKFDRWERMLTDPFLDAQEHLQDVQRELHDLDVRKAMLTEYAASLKASMERSKAATQAAPKDGK